MLGGIALTYVTQGREGRREYWIRIVDLKRIGARWTLVIFLFVPVLMGIALLLDVAASGSQRALLLVEERVAPFLAAPSTMGLFLLNVFIHGPLPEELGWRGYVLDRLQSRWNALASSHRTFRRRRPGCGPFPSPGTWRRRNG